MAERTALATMEPKDGSGPIPTATESYFTSANTVRDDSPDAVFIFRV